MEETIRSVFLLEYGAHLWSFPDNLFTFLDTNGTPLAITGLRFASERLFSENYLDAPVEAVLTEALGRPVHRAHIVEFTTLAAPRAGAAMPLIAAAVRLCRSAGAEFGIFTATERLRTLLRRSGLPAVDLGPARSERLATAANWGSYYRNDPRVMAVAADDLPAWLTNPQQTPAPIAFAETAHPVEAAIHA